MFPWLTFLKRSGRRLSDIEFLAIKEFGGKLRQNDGTLAATTTGDLATLTASSGKDMYLAKAKFNARNNSATLQATSTMVLKINGVIFESMKILFKGGTDGNSTDLTHDYEFEHMGFKVLATQIIKIEATQNSGMLLEGMIECFEETTGESPAV